MLTLVIVRVSGRWTARDKASIVRQIKCGDMTEEEALKAYDLSIEELHVWKANFESYGLAGLQATKTQAFRRIDGRRKKAQKRANQSQR